MTNGEKLQSVFPDTKIITQFDNPFGDRFMLFTLNNEDMQVNLNWWNAEYKEPTTKNNLGVDCISRADALALYCDKCGLYNCISKCASYRAVEKMPSVTPQEPRKGHWIMTGDYYTGAYGGIEYVDCSCCHESSLEEGNFCPNCGADMREVEE